MSHSLPEHLLARVEERPESPALAFAGGDGSTSWRTREEILRRALAAGAALRERGLRRGDACLIALPSDESCVAHLLGALLLGAVPLLVAPPGPGSHLLPVVEGALRKARPRVVVWPASLREPAERLAVRARATAFAVDGADPGAAPAAPLEVARPAGLDTAIMQLTSGTTGGPRICVWNHRSLLASLRTTAEAIRLVPEDVCFNWTPFYHDLGLVNNLLLCLTTGVGLVTLPPEVFVRRPAAWLRGMSGTLATISFAPNFGLALATRRATDEELAGIRLDRVRGIWSAAERVHPETMLAFHRRFERYGLRREALKSSYGLSENVGGATFSDPDGPLAVERVERDRLHRGGAVPAGSGVEEEGRTVQLAGLGRPVAGTRVRIVSRTGEALPDGAIGEIVIESRSLMTGYLRDARATRRMLRGAVLRTGDLGYLRDGELFWTGRVKERICIRGMKLDPSEFESVLLAIEGLREGSFVAFGVDDPDLGTQRVVLVSEVRDSCSRSRAELGEAIRDGVYRRLGVTVGDVLLVAEGTLRKTSSGKRRHRRYRELYLTGALRPARA